MLLLVEDHIGGIPPLRMHMDGSSLSSALVSYEPYIGFERENATPCDLRPSQGCVQARR